MASREHQFIVGLVIKQMREYGCKITHIDGKYRGTQSEPVPIPPRVVRRRPDVLGITAQRQVCIGEGKTTGDLPSPRTREQLCDFLELVLNDMPCEVFFGVPKDGRGAFERLLKEMGLLHSARLHVLYVPSEIVNV